MVSLSFEELSELEGEADRIRQQEAAERRQYEERPAVEIGAGAAPPVPEYAPPSLAAPQVPAVEAPSLAPPPALSQSALKGLEFGLRQKSLLDRLYEQRERPLPTAMAGTRLALLPEQRALEQPAPPPFTGAESKAGVLTTLESLAPPGRTAALKTAYGQAFGQFPRALSAIGKYKVAEPLTGEPEEAGTLGYQLGAFGKWLQEAISARPAATVLGQQERYEALPPQLRTALDIVPSAILMAGAGPALATVPKIGPLLAPISRSTSFPIRLAAEEAVGTAGVVAGQEVGERYGPAAGLAAGLGAGVLTAGGLMAGARAGPPLLRAAEERVPFVATAQLKRRGVPAVAGAAVERVPETLSGVPHEGLAVSGEISRPEVNAVTKSARVRTQARQAVRADIDAVLKNPALGLDEQMRAITQDYQDLSEHMVLRQANLEAARGAAPAPKFGTPERVAYDAERARLRAQYQTGEIPTPQAVRPSRYAGVEWAELLERVKVYEEFLDNMRVVPVSEMPVQPTVGRLRMTEEETALQSLPPAPPAPGGPAEAAVAAPPAATMPEQEIARPSALPIESPVRREFESRWREYADSLPRNRRRYAQDYDASQRVAGISEPRVPIGLTERQATNIRRQYSQMFTNAQRKYADLLEVPAEAAVAAPPAEAIGGFASAGPAITPPPPAGTIGQLSGLPLAETSGRIGQSVRLTGPLRATRQTPAVPQGAEGTIIGFDPRREEFLVDFPGIGRKSVRFEQRGLLAEAQPPPPAGLRSRGLVTGPAPASVEAVRQELDDLAQLAEQRFQAWASRLAPEDPRIISGRVSQWLSDDELNRVQDLQTYLPVESRAAIAQRVAEKRAARVAARGAPVPEAAAPAITPSAATQPLGAPPALPPGQIAGVQFGTGNIQMSSELQRAGGFQMGRAADGTAIPDLIQGNVGGVDVFIARNPDHISISMFPREGTINDEVLRTIDDLALDVGRRNNLPIRLPMRPSAERGLVPTARPAAEAAPPMQAALPTGEGVALPPGGGAAPPTPPTPPRPPEGPAPGVGGRPPTEPPPPAAIARPPEVERVLKQALEGIVIPDEPTAVGRAINRIPGVKPARAWEQPSLRMSRELMSSTVGQQGIQAEMETANFGSRTILYERVVSLFGKGANEGKPVKVSYKGAAPTTPGQRAVVGTMLDIIQRPSQYDLTPEQSRFIADELAARNAAARQYLKDGFGADIGEFKNIEPGAAFMRNVDISPEALRRLKTRERAARIGTEKPRFYETAWDRAAHDPQFKPETNIRVLLTGMDRSNQWQAGRQVLKIGAGARTHLELMAEQHPKLYENMMVARQRLQSLRTSAARLDERTAAAIDDFIASGGSPEDVQTFLADLPIKATIQPPPRKGMKVSPRVGMSAADIRKEIAVARGEIHGLQKAWQTALIRDYKRVPALGYDYFKTADADELIRLGGDASEMAQALAGWTATQLGGDFSPIIGVQGLLALLQSPQTVIPQLFRGGREMALARSLLRPFREGSLAEAVRNNLDAWKDYVFYSGRAFSVGTPEEFAGGLLQKLPGYSTANERLYATVERAKFGIFLDQVHYLESRGVDSIQARGAAGAQTTKFIPQWNRVRAGQSPSQAAWERAPFTSISFLRQPAALMNDVASAYVKWGLGRALTPRERIAATMFTRFAGTVMALSIGSAALDARLRGRDPVEEIKQVVNPLSGKFASLYFPGTGTRIPLGGPFRALIKAIVPRELDTPWGKAWVPFAGLPIFIANRAGGWLRTQAELLRNEDFYGNKILTGDFPMNIIQGIQYELEGIAPLTASTAARAQRQGLSPSEAATEVAGQFVGTNITGPSAHERLTDLYRKEGLPLPEVTSTLEEWLNAGDDPVRQGLIRNKIEQERRRDPEMAAFHDHQIKSTAALYATLDKLEAARGTMEATDFRHKLQGVLRKSAEDIAAYMTPSLATRLADLPAPVDKQYAAYQNYLKQLYAPGLENEYGEFNYTEYERRKQVYDLTGEYEARRKEYAHPLERRYDADMEKLRPYWDIADNTLREYAQYDVGLGKYRNYDELKLAAERAQAAGDRVDDAIILLRIINRAVEREHNLLRLDQPEIDRLLAEWFGYKPLLPQPVGVR